MGNGAFAGSGLYWRNSPVLDPGWSRDAPLALVVPSARATENTQTTQETLAEDFYGGSITMVYVLCFALAGALIYFLVLYVRAEDALDKAQRKNQELCQIIETKEREEQEQLQQNLAIAEQYAQDLEEEKAELASGYSIMATALEELQTRFEALTRHTDEHCRQIQELASFRVSFRVMQPLREEDYAGLEEPCIDESDCPTLPLPSVDWVADVEGLDTL